MDLEKLFINSDVVASVIGAILAFILGMAATFLTQLLLQKRRKAQITHSKRTEEPLIFATEKLKNKLKVFYEETQVEKLYYFSLKIVNTGTNTIYNQSFTCLFPEGTKSIDPKFPQVFTDPPREVGPIVEDYTVHKENEYRYTIETLGTDQSVIINFLTVDNPSSDFDVIFKPNEQEIDFVEGEFTGLPSLEGHIQNVVIGVSAFFISIQIFELIPFIGGAFGAIFGLPFLLAAYRSLRPVISVIARKLQTSETSGKYNINITDGKGLSIGDSAKVTMNFEEPVAHYLPPA